MMKKMQATSTAGLFQAWQLLAPRLGGADPA
jgi:hypothetical protein